MLRPLALACLLFVCAQTRGFAQERPQSTGPTLSREEQNAQRDSIRERSRIRFKDREASADADDGRDGEDAETKKKMRYEPDRALFMPAMERRAVFRIGVPGWLIRLGMRAGRKDFDSDEEYAATKAMMKGLKSIRVAAFTDNPAYTSALLRKQYTRYAKRRRLEPLLMVRAREGGVSIDFKERRGKVKRITLLAYGDEGAAVIRIKSKFSTDHLRRAIELMKDEADDKLGIEIDTDLD